MRGPVGAGQPAQAGPEEASTLKLRLNAYVGLLKPYVTLLGVTLAAMEIAQGGLPPLVGWAAVTHSVTLPAICLFAMPTLGLLYLASALALGGGFIYLAIRVLRDETRRWARTLFWYSNCYLALLFALMVLDRVIA